MSVSSRSPAPTSRPGRAGLLQTKAGGRFVEASGVATLPVTVREARGGAWGAADRRVFVGDPDPAAAGARHAIHLAPFE